MNELQALLKDLHTITGLNFTIFDIEENVITSYPTLDSPLCRLIKANPISAKLCQRCDHEAFERVKKSGKLEIYTCHCNLYEAVVPLYTYGMLSGYLMMGQTLTDTEQDKTIIKKIAQKYIANNKEIDRALQRITIHPIEQIKAIASIIDIYGKYITLTNRIEAKNRRLALEIKNYIVLNYNREITIDGLCDYFYCSRSTLINKFKEEYDTTVHQYLLDYRLDRSVELLKNNHLSIWQVATECGFSDPNYYSKIFKKKFGISPTAYKEAIAAGKELIATDNQQPVNSDKPENDSQETVNDSQESLNVSEETLNDSQEIGSSESEN